MGIYLFLAMYALSSQTEDVSTPKPNIILFSIDTLRADHLSCYGYSRETSPHIDAFSKDAVLFNNTVSQAPITAPSHMSIFTSLAPPVHGVNNISKLGLKHRLDENIITLPQYLEGMAIILLVSMGKGRSRGIWASNGDLISISPRSVNGRIEAAARMPR